MYKLILADDEAEIRQGLKEVVPFEKMGFQVVGEAANGVEALQLCEQLEPDLLITDIRMPLMDGLTLCRRVREMLPATEFVILSGFDDFEYARQAIEVKTMGYLLKPISSEEFSAMLLDARVSLDEAFGRRRDVSMLKEYFRESLPVLREMLFGALLTGEISPESALKSAARYGETLEAPGYAVARVRLGEEAVAAGIEDPELRMFAVRNVLCEVLSERAADYQLNVFMHGGAPAILYRLQGADGKALAQCVTHLGEALKTVRHYLDCPLYIGVSATVVGLDRIADAARQAQDALNRCVLSGQPQVMCFSDIRPDAADEVRTDDRELRRLGNAVKAGDPQQARAAFAALMEVCSYSRISPRAWQVYLMEIFMCFIRICSELSLPRDSLDEHMERLTQLILRHCPTVEDARDALRNALEAILEAAENQRVTSSRQLAAEAESYLRQNFSDADLSLEKLCMHLHISPSYLSMVLKKETKKTFHQILTELRMDRALTLLTASELRTADIAAQVGLPDPSYFSYCFKKHFGYPPSRARRKPH